MSTFSKAIQQTVYQNTNDTIGTDIVIGSDPSAGTYKLFKFGYFSINTSSTVNLTVKVQVFDSLSGVWRDLFTIGTRTGVLSGAQVARLVETTEASLSGYGEHITPSSYSPFIKLFPGMRVVKTVTTSNGSLRTFCQEVIYKSPNNGL
jgi:hypothetical protein